MKTQSPAVNTAHRRLSSWHGPLLLALLAAAVSVTSCSASNGTPAASQAGAYPKAIVVMGHSGTTGYNSDPANPGTDAHSNSWATGDNPKVNSIYTRLLALNPAIAGHNTNLGVDGSDVRALGPQVDKALALNPVPDLFIIQEVDADMKCDGTDKDNYEPFAKTLAADLARISKKAPQAKILLVSSPPGTVQNYGEVITALPEAKASNTGTGPCDMFTPDGKAAPAGWKYQDQVITTYHGKLAEVCKQFANCVYDDGALYRMKITAADLTPDGSHLTVSGHAKQAALEWKVLGFTP